eukprot:gene8228-8418_t
MLPIATQQLLHGSQHSRLPLWCGGGLRKSICINRNRDVAASAQSIPSADLIHWPEGTRPKRGAVTKAALIRLKVADLRAELARLGADSSGTKEELAEKLLQVIKQSAATKAERVAAAVGVRLEDLPPMPPLCKGQVYDVEDMPGLTEAERELVLKACRAGLVLTLLGGAEGDSTVGEAAPPCISLAREKDIWLWDVGEDVQRSLMWREHLKPSKQQLHGHSKARSLRGRPACNQQNQGEKGHEQADIPVHVFAPEGTADFLSTMYSCSDTFLEMPVVVHEFVTKAVPEELLAPQQLNMRAKLWRALMPPDQLNPIGFVDGDIEAFMPTQGRAKVKKGQRAAGGVLAKNPRGGHRPFPLPPPGDPSRTDVHPRDMTWTIRADEAALMTAVLLDAPDPTWGVVWREADRQGKLSMSRCEALGLKNSESSSLTWEAADKPGRKVVLLPACRSADNLARHAKDADVMFGNAAAAVVGEQQLGLGLGQCAQSWGVRNLVDNAGYEEPPPVDLEAKTADARATALMVMLVEESHRRKQLEMSRQERLARQVSPAPQSNPALPNPSWYQLSSITGFGPWGPTSGCAPSCTANGKCSNSDRWPMGMCTLKAAKTPDQPEYWSQNSEYGWVSGWVSAPRECEGLPARTCARCLAVKDQTNCLKCAKANLGKNANLLTSALLSGLTPADGCAVCFNTSQPSKCTACLSDNQTCGQCTLQDTTNAAFDVMACINCNLKLGSKYSAAWWVY